MKNIIESIIVMVSLSFFFSGCEVGITALEQAGNEVNILTTDAIDKDGNVVSRTEIPESAGDVNVSVEIYGPGSEYFTIALDQKLGVYDGLIREKENNPPVYINTTYHFFTRFVLNGQNQCKGSVTKTILRTEVAPIAEDINVILDEKTSITIDLNATDKNTNDRLSYHIIQKPQYGTLSPKNSERPTYTDINGSGTDSFTYAAYDGKMFSHVATVHIVTNIMPDTVVPVINLNGTDVNLTVGEIYTEQGAIATDDIDGNITSNIVISASVDMTTVGTYTISYDVNDSAGNQAATVTRSVNVVDATAPVITLIGGNIILPVGEIYSDAGANASDNVDGDITSAIVISGDTVNTDILGNYIIRYDVNDSAGNGASQQTRVVTVTNNKPVAVGNVYTIDEDTNLTRPLQGSDVDSGAVLTYSIVDAPSNGSVGITGQDFTYIPEPDYFGTDSFTFEVRDEFNATSNVVSINITIHDVVEPNTTPVSEDMNVSMSANTPMITFGLNASDADGNTLTYSIVSSPAFGTLTINDNLTGQVTYNRGTYTGNISFTYKVNDGTIDSNITTVYIRSNMSNTPPMAYGKSVNLDVSGAPMIVLDANDTDIGDILTYRIGTPPSYGTISLIGNQITYSPNLNYTGNDSFTFIANDGKDDSNEALVYVEVENMERTSYLFNWCKGNDEELWQTDGTQSGTEIVKNIRSGGSAIPQPFVKIKNTYFFMANDGVHGRELWKSQGTEGSTVLVKDIKTKGNGHTNPHNLIDINGTLFFAAKDGVNGIELWKSDGTTLGTKMVKNINKWGHSKPENLTNVNGTLYFVAGNGKNGRELWKSNGTSVGTYQINDINSNGSSNPKYLTNINGVLYFSADDGGTTLPDPVGRELWYYNTNISDIASGYTNRGYLDIFKGSLSGSPEELFNYNGTLVFSARTQTFGRELWISNGTSDSTKMHSNFAGTDGFFGDNRASDSNPHSFTIVGTTLYFSAEEAFYSGDSLRKIDAISSKIESVFYIDSNAEETFLTNPKNLTQSNGALFFSTYAKSVDQNGNTTDEWVQLWKASGDRAQREILFHPANNLQDMVPTNNMLYFVVGEENALDEFWKYDTTNGNIELLTTGCIQ